MSGSFQQKLTGGEVAGANLGYAVALSDDGNIALCGSIGHSSDQGIATIFTRSSTTWTHAQNFTSDDGAAGDVFGRSVALSADGSTALIGASKDDIDTKVDQGAAYIFNRSGTAWTETEQLLTGAADDQLGVAVALSADGETALVGAQGTNIGGKTDQGAAYVFKHTYAYPLYLWVVQPQLTAADGAANDLFGFSVTMSDDGDTILVGAYGSNVAGNNNQGAVYAFIPPYLVYLPSIVR